MKNKILLILFSLSLSTAAISQGSTRIGRHDAISRWTVPVNNFASVAEGKQIAQQIIDVVGLKPNFTIQAANIPNAAAVVSGGRRYVLYNPNFISQLNAATGTEWAAISVLAHEIGHHLNGHTVTSSGSQPKIELEADEFSGFVLRKMGASLAEAQAAMKLIAGKQASSTHPAQYDRLASIEDGWKHADDQMNGRSTSTARTEPAPQRPQQTAARTKQTRQTTSSTISANDIIGDIRFNADPYSKYLITSRYNVVKLENNRLYQVGKVAKMNSSRFPYMIYDERNTKFWVDRTGNIVSSKGKRVGVMAAR